MIGMAFVISSTGFSGTILPVQPFPDLFVQQSFRDLRASQATYTFKGPVIDSINYIALCVASDNTCSACTSSSGTPLPYTTTGTTYSINLAAIAAYLSANNLGAGTYNVGMYVQSTHMT